MAKEEDVVMQDANGVTDKKDKKDDKKDDKLSTKKKGKAAEKPELSEEDLELKANLEMIVERISDSDPAVQSSALDNMSRHVLIDPSIFCLRFKSCEMKNVTCQHEPAILNKLAYKHTLQEQSMEDDLN